MGRYTEFLPRGLPITDIRKTPDTYLCVDQAQCGLPAVQGAVCQGLLYLLWTVFSEEKLQPCIKSRNFQNPFFFTYWKHCRNMVQTGTTFSKFIIKFRKRKIILFIFILCYLGLNIDLVQLKLIFITVVEMLILGPHQDCVLSTLLSRAIEHTALSALSLLICTLKSVAEKWFSKLGLGVYEV